MLLLLAGRLLLGRLSLGSGCGFCGIGHRAIAVEVASAFDNEFRGLDVARQFGVVEQFQPFCSFHVTVDLSVIGDHSRADGSVDDSGRPDNEMAGRVYLSFEFSLDHQGFGELHGSLKIDIVRQNGVDHALIDVKSVAGFLGHNSPIVIFNRLFSHTTGFLSRSGIRDEKTML